MLLRGLEKLKFVGVLLFVLGAACLETENVLNNQIQDQISSNDLSMASGGGQLYLANFGDHTIDVLNISSGARFTLAGQKGVAGTQDGGGTLATFTQPRAIAFRPGNPNRLYVMDASCILREINLSTAMVATIAGSAGVCNTLVDGAGATARFFGNFRGMAIKGDDLYLSDGSGHRIRKVDLAANPVQVSTIAGQAGEPGFMDGSGLGSKFNLPAGLAIAGNNIFVVDSNNNSVRKIDLSTYRVSTVVGNGVAGYKDGVGIGAQMGAAFSITSDGGSNLYLADRTNHAIRKIQLNNFQMSLVLGGPERKGDKDGRIDSAATFNPLNVHFTDQGIYFYNGYGLRRIR